MDKKVVADTLPFTNDAIDSTSQLIVYKVPVEIIREGLLARGLSPYDAYLCYKAADFLLKAGFYERSSRAELFCSTSMSAV